MKIQMIFLGTGQAVPTSKRNHTSILLKYKDENILIDCGEGTQRQFRIAKENPCKLTRILITHWHGDHVLGLPGLLQTLCLNNYNKTLNIYGPRGTKNFVSLLEKLFVKQGKIKILVHEINSNKVFETSDFEIKSEKMFHGSPCLAYSFIEKDKIRIKKSELKKLNIHGKIISELAKGKNIKNNGKIISAKNLTYKEKGRKITIILDTIINPNMKKIALNSDLLISEATYSESEKNLAENYKHLTSSQSAQTAKSSKSKKLILTHISQRYEKSAEQLLKEARKIFPNTSLAEDFDKIEI